MGVRVFLGKRENLNGGADTSGKRNLEGACLVRWTFLALGAVWLGELNTPLALSFSLKLYSSFDFNKQLQIQNIQNHFYIYITF